jgi:hypothetical protein
MQTPAGHAPILDVLVAADVDVPATAPTQHMQHTQPTTTTSATDRKVLKRRKSSREYSSATKSAPRTSSSARTAATHKGKDAVHHERVASKTQPRSNQAPSSLNSGPALTARRSLHSMGGAAFAKFDASHESLGSQTIAGINAASGFPVHAAELDSQLDASHSLDASGPEPCEDRWMHWRQAELERLRVRKDMRRVMGTSFIGSELSLRIPEEEGGVEHHISGGGYHRYAHPNPLRYKSGAASLSSLGNVGTIVPPPPIPGPSLTMEPPVHKPARLQTKRSKASSISASFRDLVMRRE